MKLLLDQNLSRRLLPDLDPLFPGSTQVALCGLDTAPDLVLWEYARVHGFCLVTKDADFLELAALRGIPPKILRLNMSNARIREVLLEQASGIQAFLQDAIEGILELD